MRLLPLVAGALVAALSLPAGAGARNVYVTNQASNTVSVVDTASNAVTVPAIATGASPYAIAITPDGSRAYVVNSGAPGTVSVIDTATNAIAGGAIPVGTLPQFAAVTPDGSRVYVANRTSSSVSVIDTATNTVTSTIPGVGTGPTGVAITPDGRRAYVTDFLGGAVSVIDTATNTVTTLILGAGPGPLGIAITPDGSRAYVVNSGANSVSVIDTASDQVVGSPIAVEADPQDVAITPDGTRAYVTNLLAGPPPAPGTVSVIDTASNSVIKTIAVGQGPIGVAITPDGTRAYVTNYGVVAVGTTVSVIDTGTNTVTGTPITVGNTPSFAAIVPDQGPKASFTYARSSAAAASGATIAFDATASSDPDGTVARYDWEFGDGQTLANGGPTPTHTYASPGNYAATLTVADNLGTSTQQIFTGQTMLRNGTSAAKTSRSVDLEGPTVTITTPKKGKRIKQRRFKRIAGTAADEGSGVSQVEVALMRKVKQKVKGKRRTRCLRLRSTAGRFDRKPRSCKKLKFLAASGTTSWQLKLKRKARRRLKRGSYTAYAQATDTAGNTSGKAQVTFRIR